MKYFLIATYFLLHTPITAQTDTTLFNSFFVLSSQNEIKVLDPGGTIVFSKSFHQPYQYLADVDDDQFDEFIVVDSVINENRLDFTIYLFNAEGAFSLIDSIYSGSFFPFITYSEEILSLIIETGNPEFEKFNRGNELVSLPLNLWKVENNEVIKINDEVYEPFIFENTNLLQFLDFYSHEKGFNCTTTQFYRGILAAAYTNYINAGEQSLAVNLLKKYYLCEDVEQFKQEIIKLIFPEAK